MYHWPERYGGQHCKKFVNQDDVQYIQENYVHSTPKLYDPQIKELVTGLLPNHPSPNTPEDTFNLFIEIIKIFQNIDDDKNLQ